MYACLMYKIMSNLIILVLFLQNLIIYNLNVRLKIYSGTS